MKKTWFVLPGYIVGLSCLVLITYRTLLAVSTPGKVILVSVNRFGEQYLDLIALVFLWVVCLVGLLCLTTVVKDLKREESFARLHSKTDDLVSPVLSFRVFDSLQQPSIFGGMDETAVPSSETSLSFEGQANHVTASIIVRQGEIRE